MNTTFIKYFSGALWSLLLLLSFSLKAADAQGDYTKANEYYKKMDYDNAAKMYEQLLKDGNVSAEIYFNLGNSYYKEGNTAKAILNYERALKLAPDDEDINFNLKIAQLKVVDKMETVPDIFYRRWLKAVATMFSLDTWSKLFITFFWLVFAGATGFVLSRRPASKKAFFVAGIIALFLSVSSYLFAQQSNTLLNVNKSAIITSASVYVKSSPDEKGNDEFIIHEGTKVDLLDELLDWRKIRIANGSVGWMKVTDLEVI